MAELYDSSGEVETGLDVEAVLRERYLSFRLHHAELGTVDSPEGFADSFVEWAAAHVAAVLRVEIESALAPVRALAERWQSDPGRRWTASCGDELMDELNAISRATNPYRASLAATEGDRQ